MRHELEGGIVLRPPEPEDVEALYRQKNDPEIGALLGGFGTGYSRAGLRDWIEYHRKRTDEVIWTIADTEDRCLGHVGLYRIDHRVRSAEFAIMLGERAAWGRGTGKRVTQFAVNYGFDELNLNRVSLQVLAGNERALGLYRSLGFETEGTLRQAQFKGGRYLDVVMMALLRAAARPADAP